MRKMMLVPSTHPTVQSPLIAKLSRLDQEMKSILDRQDIDEHSKVTEYSQILTRYLDTRDKLSRPTSISIIDKQSPTTKTDSLNLASIPLPYQKKARLIAQHLDRDPTIGWNELNELRLSGRTVPNSNMIDLIDDLARPNSRTQPTGIEELVEELKRSNIPRSIVGNKNRLSNVHDSLPHLSSYETHKSPRRQRSPHYADETLSTPPAPQTTPSRSSNRSRRKQRGRGWLSQNRARWTHW